MPGENRALRDRIIYQLQHCKTTPNYFLLQYPDENFLNNQ